MFVSTAKSLSCSIIVSTTTSIHAPRRGATICIVVSLGDYMCFNSRTPCGVRRGGIKVKDDTKRFNSRTPCGVRLLICEKAKVSAWFQFTHPVRGATVRAMNKYHSEEFQFTHPVRGATPSPTSSACLAQCFNSRTPCGVRLVYFTVGVPTKMFQFTHPVRGATPYPLSQTTPPYVSIHAPRAGCDLFFIPKEYTILWFQFTHPVRGAT